MSDLVLYDLIEFSYYIPRGLGFSSCKFGIWRLRSNRKYWTNSNARFCVVHRIWKWFGWRENSWSSEVPVCLLLSMHECVCYIQGTTKIKKNLTFCFHLSEKSINGLVLWRHLEALTERTAGHWICQSLRGLWITVGFLQWSRLTTAMSLTSHI